MELRRIRSFVEVADCQSFTRAGGKLSIAQSALSRQIRDLESELGIVLLHRTGRGVQLTDAGRIFLDRARKLLRDAEYLVAETKSASDRGGSVQLGLLPSIMPVLLAPLLNRVRRENPHVRMRVVEGFSGHVSEWLLSGRIDLAILYRSSSTASLLADCLLAEDMYLIGPPGKNGASGSTVPLAAVADLPLALPGRPHGLRLLVDRACERSGVELLIEIEVDAFSVMKELAQSGEAYTILPFCAVAREVDGGRLSASRIVDPVITRELVLASSTQRPHTRAAQDVARILRQQVVDLVSTGRWQATMRSRSQPPRDASGGYGVAAGLSG